jgi:preprotein translocase subunit SecE
MAGTTRTEGNQPMSQPDDPSPDESERPEADDEQDSAEEAPAQKPPRYAKARKLTDGGSGSSGGGGGSQGGGAGGGRSRSASDGGFFNIYKKGQGYWTRMGTAIAAALLAGLTASFVYGQADSPNRGLWPLGLGIAVMIGLLLLFWWIMNAPGNADFLIATDSEMKKVNWTKPADLMGSTKVVILFMFLIALFLFVCDLVLQWIIYFCISGLPRPW